MVYEKTFSVHCEAWRWGYFSRFGIGPLHKVEGTTDRFMYKNIFENKMEPYAEEIYTYTFQHDNDPKHKSKLVTEWLELN